MRAPTNLTLPALDAPGAPAGTAAPDSVAATAGRRRAAATAGRRRAVDRRAAGGIPAASLELLAGAVAEIEASVGELRPADRYARGHLAARRTAAAVLAACARPDRTSRPQDVWTVLPAVVPELREWAAFFAAGNGKRIAAEVIPSTSSPTGSKGSPTGSASSPTSFVVTAREADDLVRDAHNFLDVVVATLARRMGRRTS